MSARIVQPPIDPAARDPERHDFWAGFIPALIGLLVIVCGARHMTNVDTVEGNTAWETQLVKALSSGGLEYMDAAAAPPPTAMQDPFTAAAALERVERQNAKAARIKFRVNTGAANPCPT